jgi:hypothetical protein
MLMIQKQHTKIDKNKYTKNNPNLPKHYTVHVKKKKNDICLVKKFGVKRFEIYFGAGFL